MSKATMSNSPPRNYTVLPLCLLFLAVGAAILLYGLDDLKTASMPESSLSWAHVPVANHNAKILDEIEKVGEGLLPGPEDIAYDPEDRVIYTGCHDGWIRRLMLNDLAVEDWVYVGGRPLGVVLTSGKELLIAEADTGLVKVAKDKDVTLLTDEAEGLKFKLTNGIDVANNGVIYFTDASWKYNLQQHVYDVLEGQPYGRFLSYDPSTNTTEVLVHDLYFANGVAISPEQDFVIFCETPLRRCQKYYIKGENKGKLEKFVDNLPGYPDNIRYDGKDTYWIALAMGKTFFWDVTMRYPWIRKATGMLSKFMKIPHMQSHSGVLAVNLKGEMIALYTDRALAMVTVGIKIGNYLYYGSLTNAYFGRLKLTEAYNVADI